MSTINYSSQRKAGWLPPLLTLALLLVAITQAAAQVVTYTTSGTYVVPAGVTQITVECWGGGGRGGSRTDAGPGGGGGGGAYARSVLTVTPSTTYTVTVGAGSSSTAAGGDSRFHTGATNHVLAKGGNSAPNNSTAPGTGGASGSCIGTFVFSGGNGATGNVNGGGGGSSAGTANNGAVGAVSNGGTAPAGGGNGGNGRNGSNDDGFSGAAPGGGGGGCRANVTDRIGGTGGNGRVIVSFDPNGLCMAALPAINAIADNVCVTPIPIAISGLPTTLGTAAGNARLLSVELIINHTFNDDLDITLTSPSGVTRTLSSDNGGNGDNMGDPATCPNSPLILLDGAPTALPDGDTPTLVGTYAPEQSYSAFTGNPNGNWILNICDDANNDVGNLRYVKLNFCTVPQITASSSNSPICSNSALNLSVTATGTAPLNYLWTGTGAFSPGTSSTSPSVTGAATGNYNIAVSNTCGSTNTNVAVSVTTAASATISYGALPFCQSAGSVSVTRTGTAGGTYTASPVGLSINASSGAVDLAASTTGTYTVTYTIAANGPCPQFTTQASITINAPPTRYRDLDSDGFGDPADFITSCSPVAGYVLDNTDNCPLLFGKIGDTCNDGSANTINDVITGACVCAGTNMPWYSQGNGSFTDAIWSQNVNGPGAAATLDAGSDIIIKTGHTITQGGAQAIRNLTVQNGGALALGSNTLTVNGASTQIDGSLNGGTGTMILQPTTAGTLSGSGTHDYNNLTVSASAGLTCSASAGIRGTLLLSNGTFTASGTVTLVSNASGTGRLGPVAPTASYSGNLVVNRYIPAGATNWRMMGSPVAGQTVNNWKDDFYTAGFPGSHSPNFASPVGSGILWPSVRWYNETNTGAAVIDGLTGATSNTQSLAAGQGFAAWCGTGYATTTAFTVDMTGAPNVAQTPISLPMSYTNTGAPATDGWNMVSNPLPSPILFSNITRGANVEDYITYFDPATGNNATYDISMNSGTNGGTNTIQSSQAFWLKANGAAVTTTVDENDKVAGNGGGFFGGDQEQVANILRLRLHSIINQYSDETLVVFSEGTPGADADDVPKFVFAHPEAPQVATMADNGGAIAINAFGPYTTDISIPVLVNVAVNGNYTITATGLDHVGLSCLRLEDLSTGTITPLVEGASYTFTALANDDETEPRLLLHASAPMTLTQVNASCAGRDDGSATVEVSSGPVDVLWMDADDVVVLEQNNVGAGPTAIVALEAGEYSVQVTSNAGCGTVHTNFTIEEPSAIEVTADAMPASCPATADGTIDLMVLGGEAPYTYQWSNGSEESSIEVAAGTYTVEITDANGCSITPQEYVVSAGEGPEASIAVESSTVMVDDEVSFYSASGAGIAHSWDFGDETTSEEAEPVHVYSTPGTYTVTLTVDDGTCSNTTSLEIVVESTTGLPTIVGATLNAWVSGDQFVVDHNFSGNDPVLVRILGSNGQLLQEHRLASAPARITLPTTDLPTGIYLLRISSGSNARTFSLPVAR
ncbi:MAG: PKD domain-containing protein [Flavobacteriales bacterium]|nr:PKD domain-containing protein [Flavobacteriales bacterium]